MKTLNRIKRVVIATTLLFAALAATSTGANPIVEFPLAVGSDPNSIVAGPDGNLWFTEARPVIGRMHPDGSLEELISARGGPAQIVVGADRNLWFVDPYNQRITRIREDGSTTNFSTRCDLSGYITAGPNKSLWFPESCGGESHISEMATLGAAAGTIKEHPLATGVTRILQGIATGADGNVWFVDYFRNSVTRLDVTSDEFAEFFVPGASGFLLVNVIQGPDHKIWVPFNETIARISINGDIDEFDLPNDGGAVNVLTVAKDGSVWATENATLRRIALTPSGMSFSRYPVSGANGLACITAGPDGNMWFTENISNRIGRIASDAIFFDSLGDTP